MLHPPSPVVIPSTTTSMASATMTSSSTHLSMRGM